MVPISSSPHTIDPHTGIHLKALNETNPMVPMYFIKAMHEILLYAFLNYNSTSFPNHIIFNLAIFSLSSAGPSQFRDWTSTLA